MAGIITNFKNMIISIIPIRPYCTRLDGFKRNIRKRIGNATAIKKLSSCGDKIVKEGRLGS